MRTPQPAFAFNARQVLAVAAACALTASCDVSGDQPDRVVADFNGTRRELSASIRMSSQPLVGDSLFVAATDNTLFLTIALEFEGPGHYLIGPDQVRLDLLVGGDAFTGSYEPTPVGGTLDITAATGYGEPLRAEFRLDATHAAGEARYGDTLAISRGRITGILQHRE